MIVSDMRLSVRFSPMGISAICLCSLSLPSVVALFVPCATTKRRTASRPLALSYCCASVSQSPSTVLSLVSGPRSDTVSRTTLFVAAALLQSTRGVLSLRVHTHSAATPRALQQPSPPQPPGHCSNNHRDNSPSTVATTVTPQPPGHCSIHHRRNSPSSAATTNTRHVAS